MTPLFIQHNRHLDNPKRFSDLDPNLSYLSTLPFAYEFPLVSQLPTINPGIYTLGGGRQIGKTTLLKQWMQHLLKQDIPSETIRFLTGDLIDNHHMLVNLFQSLYEELPQGKPLYIILDEVTYIKNWDKGIKYLADVGLFSKTILILTGSDLKFLKESIVRFPGRRGKADEVDFHLYPLSFSEVLTIKASSFRDNEDIFQDYLIHGGYLTAINDIALYGEVKKSTLQTYSDWIRGDILKQGKKESYLNEILQAIVATYGSQVTWNSLSQHTSVNHPSTVQDYCETLQSMESLFIQSALIEEKLLPAPKKAKKLLFCDPFIFHSVRHLLKGILPTLDNDIEPFLVETVVINHVRRFFKTYYIKGEGEVDLAYINNNKFWPVEIKWRNQLRPKDLKQILKYKNHLILTKTREMTSDRVNTDRLINFIEKFGS